jgi:flavin-dependent dehydrogenase
MKQHTFDIAVFGAGPAGSGSALFLAEAGYRVALIEQRAFAKAGPSWVNAVYAEGFSKIGLRAPEGDEVELADFPVTFFSADLAERLDVAASGFTNVRMRPFVDRLQRDAFAAGVVGFDLARFEHFTLVADRPVVASIVQQKEGQEGEAIEIKARLFVDATGIAGSLREQVAALRLPPAAAGDSDLCTALQQNCHVTDPAAAAEFLAARKVAAGTLISILGTQGGFSTLSVQVSPDLSEVGILAGSIKEARFLTGTQMVKKFCEEHPWIGAKIHSGGGTIPLRHPLHRLTAPGVAVVGNAANQVFSVHGSGVMPSLQAARLLADAVADAADPGDEAVLWRYASAFQQSLGAMLASYDLFRRFSQNLTSAEIAKMFRYSLMNEAMMLAGIRQVMPEPSLTSGLSMLATGVRDPLFAAALVRSLARMPLVYLHYQNFPEVPDKKKFAGWVAYAKRLGV